MIFICYLSIIDLMFNILEEAGAKLRMRPMAVTHVNKFVKCVYTN